MKVLIWGTGQFAQKVIEHIEYVNKIFGACAIEIEGFIDNNSSVIGSKMFDRTVLSPGEISVNHLPIIIAVKFCDDIKEQIESTIGGEYYTYYDIIYSDKLFWNIAPLKINDVVKKVNIQKKILQNEIDKLTNIEYIAGVQSLLPVDFVNAEKELDKLAVCSVNSAKNNKRKRIAIYYHRLLNGGVERVISHLLREFCINGYEVHLLLDEKNSCADYSIYKDVKVHINSVKNHENNFIWMTDIAQYLIDNRIECLISHESYWEGNYFLNKICQLYNIRFILEIHNHHSGFVNRKLSFYEELYKSTDKVVVLNDEDLIYWKKYHIDVEKIINPVYVNKKKEVFEGKNILWVGRLNTGQKNVYEIIKVAELLCEMKNDVRFHIVGDFENEATEREFCHRIREKNLANYFIFHGYQKDVEPYYMDADLMIMTSRYEGFAMTITEALSFGIPVFAYDLPYLEVMKRGRGTIVVPQGDYIGLADKIRGVLEDKTYLLKLSDEAYECAKELAEENIMEKWERVINE